MNNSIIATKTKQQETTSKKQTISNIEHFTNTTIQQTAHEPTAEEEE